MSTIHSLVLAATTFSRTVGSTVKALLNLSEPRWLFNGSVFVRFFLVSQ
ncbi:hypothetical protein CGRA01v4_05278 [Colletotrichum graminicola]|nr:hypothetical protein CGRA01v4_05278 [Colletotrichum graminicola]